MTTQSLLESLVWESRIESAENRIRAQHNATCRPGQIMPYQSCAFLRMVDAFQACLEKKISV